jgi:hypothetical protein
MGEFTQSLPYLAVSPEFAVTLCAACIAKNTANMALRNTITTLYR